MRSHPLVQLTLVKIRDLLREKEALFWVFVFPLLLAVALGIAFRGQEASPVPVGVVAGPGAEGLAGALRGSAQLDVREFAGEDEAGDALRRGRVAIVVLPGDPPTYWYDPTRQDSAFARLATDQAVQRGAGRVDPVRPEAREMTETGSRYIDFLLPGLIGMNLMGTGMWGVGYGIVEYRTKGILKRLAATPMRRSHFLLAQILGRLAFVIAEVAVLLGFGRLAFGVPMRGSYALFVAIAVLGGMAFAGIGLSTAARTKTVEGAAGLIQLVQLPMWILSGIFFSTSRFPEAMQPVVKVLPLTALLDALRGVMLDGAGIAQVAGPLAITAAWGATAFALALAGFRWR